MSYRLSLVLVILAAFLMFGCDANRPESLPKCEPAHYQHGGAPCVKASS